MCLLCFGAQIGPGNQPKLRPKNGNTTDPKFKDVLKAQVLYGVARAAAANPFNETNDGI